MRNLIVDEHEFSLLIVQLGSVVFVLFVAVCLATGLYYIAELIEEHTTLARKVLKVAVQATLVLHVLALFLDSLPLLCIGLGAAAQVSYWFVLKTYPFVDFLSVEFIAATGLLMSTQIAWVQYFYTTSYSVEYILGFFEIMVWLVPFVVFISLSTNDQVLPGCPGGPRYTPSVQVTVTPSRTPKPQRGVLLNIFHLLRRHGDQLLPQVVDSAMKKQHSY